MRAAGARRPPGGDRAAHTRARARPAQDIDPRGARTGAILCAELRACRGRVPGDRGHRPDERLRVVLPGALDAAARPSPRGLPSAGRRVLNGALTRGLPPLPRSCPPRRGEAVTAQTHTHLLFRDGRVPMLFSNDSFRAVVDAAAGSTGSGRTPAFFTPHAWGE